MTNVITSQENMAIKATIPSFNENNFIAWVLLLVKRHDKTNRRFTKCFVVTKRLNKKTTYFSRRREENLLPLLATSE
jgi:hypothetical protein